MKVTDPSGQTWRVTRRWVPWRRRLKGSDAADIIPSGPTGLGDDPISAIIGLVFLVLAIPGLALLALAAVEFLLLLLVVPFALLGRVLFGRHWHVEIRRGFQPFFETEAGDWQASSLKIHEFADHLRRGVLPERTLVG